MGHRLDQFARAVAHASKETMGRNRPAIGQALPDGQHLLRDRKSAANGIQYVSRHIVIVCPALAEIGSVSNIAVRQARELAKRFLVTVVSDSLPDCTIPEIAWHQADSLKFGVLRRFAHVPNEIAFAVASRVAIAQLHLVHPVDIVICHGHPVASLAGRPLQRRLHIRYALVSHGDIFDRPRGTYDSRLTWFYQRMTPPAYRDADLVIALSPHMSALARRGGASANKVVLVPNGIDPAEIGLADSSSPSCPAGRLEMLYVGRLSIEKGVDLLLRSAAVLKDRGVAFHLRIAGCGVDAESLRLQVAALKLEEKVAFLGRVPRQNLGALYQSADVLCIPSRSEPFGIVALEAMAAGIPVVAAAVGGIPYVVEHGVTGLLCPVDDPVAFAAALQLCAAERETKRAMGLAGRDRVVNEFNWPKIGKRLAEALFPAPRAGPELSA